MTPAATPAVSLEELARWFEREHSLDAPWLAEMRRHALAHFRDVGFPTTRQEEWRWTNVAPIAHTRFQSASPADSVEPLRREIFHRMAPYAPRSLGGYEIVFINGVHAPELSTAPAPAIQITTLRNAMARHGEMVRAHLGREALWEQNGFAALNTAGFQDGAFIHVPDGVVVDKPIHLLFFTTAGRAGTPLLVQPRNLVLIGAGARLVLACVYAGQDAAAALTNPVLEMVLGEAAQVELVKLQRESDSAFHVAHEAVRLRAAANLLSLTLNLGGGLVRNNLSVRLDGPGAQATLNGLTLAAARRHVDNHTLLDHACANSTSHELYKYLLAGRAGGVFRGKILVRPGAQKTDARQTSKTILLSDKASMNSQPQLEIYADDVKCTHGSTTGPLDDEQIFYLRSRGIAAVQARTLLTYAFAGDVLQRVRYAPWRQYLEALVAGELNRLHIEKTST